MAFSRVRDTERGFQTVAKGAQHGAVEPAHGAHHGPDGRLQSIARCFRLSSSSGGQSAVLRAVKPCSRPSRCAWKIKSIT